MKKYTVLLASNGQGYFNYRAENPDNVNEFALIGVDTVPGGTNEIGNITIVHRATVSCDTAIGAIEKYRKWQSNGEQESWLSK